MPIRWHGSQRNTNIQIFNLEEIGEPKLEKEVVIQGQISG